MDDNDNVNGQLEALLNGQSESGQNLGGIIGITASGFPLIQSPLVSIFNWKFINMNHGVFTNHSNAQNRLHNGPEPAQCLT